MKTIKNLVLLVSLTTIWSVLPSCTGYKDIKPISYKIKSFSPTGLRNADINLEVNFYNPAKKMYVKYIKGDIFRNDTKLASIESGSFIINGKSNDTKTIIPINARLDSGFSIIEAMSIISELRDKNDFYADIEMKVKIGAVSRKFKLSKIPVVELLKFMGNTKSVAS